MSKQNKRYRISKSLVIGVLLLAVPAIYALSQWVMNSETTTIINDKPNVEQSDVEDMEFETKGSFLRFGLDTSRYHIVDDVLSKGQTLGEVFLNVGFSHRDVYNIAQTSDGIFDVRYVKAGEQYHWAFERNGDSLPVHLIYEKSPLVYYHFYLRDSLRIERFERETHIRIDTAVATVTSSLYESLRIENVPVQVIMNLADVYGWVIDFFRIQKGDYVKMTYEVRVVDDSLIVGFGRIPSAVFYHGGRELYSFFYRNEDGSYQGYFDENGDAMRKAFLKAPLDFFRISSRYNPKRFHPVLKRVKPHLGTDYAAPTGTPIRSTADGVIEKMGYTSGNGNYVKVRHNSTYSTQYLHMSKFAQGMKKGSGVKQGEVIGYVGSTGLATGPHVCYRFWKNGVQVDPLKEELPAAEPIDETERENFSQQMKVMKKDLIKLSLPNQDV